MSKVLSKVSGVTHKIQDFVWSGSLALGVCMAQMAAYATNTKANAAMTSAINVIGKIVCIPGAFFLIFGLIHYAEARSEGDGPAKNKSMMQVSSGIMVLLVGILLTTNWVGTFIANFFV